MRLRDLGVAVIEAPTPDGVVGFYDPNRRQVVIAPGLSVRERASTLAHELVHAEVGDRSSSRWWSRANADVSEDCADEVAARNLILLPELVDALLTCDTLGEVAEWLGVDDEMVQARIDTLTAGERRYVDRRTITELPLRRLA